MNRGFPGIAVTLFFAVFFMAGPSWAKCGAATRTTLDTLKCQDTSRNTWYEVKVNKMCGTYSGEEQTLVELVELRPGQQNQRATIWQGKMAADIAQKGEGKSQYSLFKQRIAAKGKGDDGHIEALANLSKDRKSVESVEVKIQPVGGDPCMKTISVAEAWTTKW